MFKVHLRRMLVFMGVLGLLGWLYASRQPKIYQATVSLQAGSPQVGLDPNLSTEIQRTIAPNLNADLDSDVGLLRSQKIFRDGLIRASQDLRKDTLATTQSFAELYPMYEVKVPDSLNQYAQAQQRILTLQVRAFTPEDAAQIATNVGYAFSDYRKQRTKASLADATRELRRQLQTQQTKSSRLAEEYRKVKAASASADFVGKNQAITASLEALRIQRVNAANALAAKESEISSLSASLSTTQQYVQGGTTSIADPSVDLLKNTVARAEDDYESLRVQFQDDAPLVVEARRKLQRVRATLAAADKVRKDVRGSSNLQLNTQYLQLNGTLAQTRAEAAGLRSTIAGLDQAVAEKRVENSTAPTDEIKIQELLRDRQSADENVVKLEKALSNYDQGMSTPLVSILEPADPEASREPVAPEVRRWVIVAVFAGALLGLAYSFAVESLRLPVHTSWQLSELTALPVSAAVPSIPRPLARRHEQSIREGTFKPIESFRYMAFSLLNKEPRPKTAMFSGVGGDVGASSAAAEFAVAVSRTGTRTALVDFDLRSPKLSSLFALSGRTGISDILGATVLGGGGAEDLTVATEHENLFVLPAGSATDAGIADFQTARLSGLLQDLSARFDMVVLSCPPVDVYSDAARLAPYVEESILVVSAKTTSYRAIPMAQEIMEKAGAKNVSLVLTNASPNDEPFGTRISDSLVNA